MRLKDIQINPETFFKVVLGCFSVIGIANLISLILSWETTILWGKVASIGGIIFNVAMILLFNHLLSIAEPKVETEYGGDDIDDLLEEIKQKEETTNEPTRTKKKVKRSKPKA